MYEISFYDTKNFTDFFGHFVQSLMVCTAVCTFVRCSVLGSSPSGSCQSFVTTI